MTMWTNSIFNRMDDLLEFANHNTSTYAKTDIRQTEDGYSIDVLLPGFEKEEVQVKTEGSDLILEAKTERALPKFLNKNVKKTYQVEDLDVDSVAASLNNGILTINFSTSKKKNSRSISIL